MPNVVSLRKDCVSIPADQAELVLTPSPQGVFLSLSIVDLPALDLPPDAEAFVEIAYPSQGCISVSLGLLSEHPEGQFDAIQVPEIAISREAALRVVILSPSDGQIIAQPERLSPGTENPTKAVATGPDSSRSFVKVQEDESLELPWVAVLDPDYPLIAVNPRYLSKTELKANAVRAADVLPAAITMFALALQRHPGKFTSPHWKAFQNRAASLMGAEDWDSLTDTPGTDHYAMATEIAAAFFIEGGMQTQIDRGISRLAKRKSA